MTTFVKQFDDVMRERYGSAPHGGERKSGQVFDTNTWSQKSTAKALGITQATVSKCIKIAELMDIKRNDYEQLKMFLAATEARSEDGTQKPMGTAQLTRELNKRAGKKEGARREVWV